MGNAMTTRNKTFDRDQGLKKDSGKARWELLPLDCVEGTVDVLTFGAQKYEDHGWKKLMETEEGEQRVIASLIRHLVEIQKHGIDAKDEESGLPHVDHLNCNGLFLKYRQLFKLTNFDRKEELPNGMRHDETLGMYINRAKCKHPNTMHNGHLGTYCVDCGQILS